MKNLLKNLFVLTLAFSSFNILAQNNPDNVRNRVTTKMYYYTFSGVLSFDNIETLKNEINNMQFVTEVKIEYKADKSMGQIRLIAKEFYTNNDTDFEFNIYNLKMLLIRNNLNPNEYKSELITQ